MKPSMGRRALLRSGCVYLLALLTPIVLCLCLMTQAGKGVVEGERARLIQELTAQARQTALVLDAAVERAQMAAYSLWREDCVSSLLRGGTGGGDTYRTINQLKSVTLINSRLIEDIALCFHSHGLALTAAGRTTTAKIYGRFIAGEENVVTWEEQAKGFSSGQLFCRPGGGLTFMQTYPVTPIGEQSRATLLVLLREKISDDTLIVDEHTEAFLCGQLMPDALTAVEQSGRLPVRYMAQASTAELAAHAAALRQQMALAWLLCVGAGIALAFWFAKRRLDPLRRLAALARGESGALPLDPYAEVQTALMDAAQQRLAYLAVQNQEKTVEQLRLLTTALSDDALDEEHLRPYMKVAGLLQAGRSACLVRLICTDADAYLLGGEAEQSPLSLAGEVTRQLLSRLWQIKAASVGDSYCFFLLLEEKQLEGLGGQVSDILEKARRLLREGYGVDTLTAQSSPQWDAMGMRAAYFETENALRMLCQTPLTAPVKPDNWLCRKAMDVAAAHCTDPNLSVSMVAGMVGYNVEYLSRTFKRIMGTGLLSYIHSLQVEKAKALLEENPGISIRQVAGMVGFSGSESFIRTFKRHQGTTPGRYQEEHNAKNL